MNFNNENNNKELEIYKGESTASQELQKQIAMLTNKFQNAICQLNNLSATAIVISEENEQLRTENKQLGKEKEKLENLILKEITIKELQEELERRGIYKTLDDIRDALLEEGYLEVYYKLTRAFVRVPEGIEGIKYRSKNKITISAEIYKKIMGKFIPYEQVYMFGYPDFKENKED